MSAFTVELDNSPGELARLCEAMASSGVNLLLCATTHGNSGREHIDDPAKSLAMGLPGDLMFRTKGQLAIDLLTEVFADGVRLDFVCGTRSMAAAPSCGSTWKNAARATCCGCRRTFTSRWPAG